MTGCPLQQPKLLVIGDIVRFSLRLLACLQTYSGSVNPSSGTLQMRFEVQGLRGRFAEMCAEIGAAPCVRSWRIA